MKNNKIIFAAIISATTFLGYNALAAQTTPDWVVQNAKATPGMLNSSVTQANIATTVCKSGWTATIRPTVTYTNKLKDTQLKTTYLSYTKIWGPAASAYEETFAYNNGVIIVIRTDLV